MTRAISASRIQLVLIHQIHEQLPEGLAAGNEALRRFVERGTGRHRRQCALETARADRGELSRREQILDRQHLVAGPCSAR